MKGAVIDFSLSYHLMSQILVTTTSKSHYIRLGVRHIFDNNISKDYLLQLLMENVSVSIYFLEKQLGKYYCYYHHFLDLLL